MRGGNIFDDEDQENIDSITQDRNYVEKIVKEYFTDFDIKWGGRELIIHTTGEHETNNMD